MNSPRFDRFFNGAKGHAYLAPNAACPVRPGGFIRRHGARADAGRVRKTPRASVHRLPFRFPATASSIQSIIEQAWSSNSSFNGAAPLRARNWFGLRTATLNNDTLQRSLDSVRLLAGLIEEANVARRNVQQIYTNPFKCRQNLLHRWPASLELLPFFFLPH